MLKEIWTGFPHFKLQSEDGVPEAKVRTFPWLQTPYMAIGSLGIAMPPSFVRELEWWARITLDRHVSRRLEPNAVLIALSSSGLRSGTWIKKNGGHYFCDRGSSHIRFQNDILRQEYARWKVPFTNIDPRIIEQEEAEYAMADFVSVPSTFVFDSFLKSGYPKEKIFLNPYGARLERFRRVAEPASNSFTALFVGQVSIRKGFLYLLQAFNQLKHPKKKLKVIGVMSSEIKHLLINYELKDVEFVGVVPNQKLPWYYSRANVMVLPSIEEGLAMVIGEALACGCPVIATENTGASDFYSNEIEGFIVPPRSSTSILRSMQALADEGLKFEYMVDAAQRRVATIGGWDAYGARWADRIRELI